MLEKPGCFILLIGFILVFAITFFERPHDEGFNGLLTILQIIIFVVAMTVAQFWNKWFK